MAIAHAASSAATAGTTTPNTWSHAAGASVTPDWVLVFVMAETDTTDTWGAVSYDGVALSEVPRSYIADTSVETGSVKAYFSAAGGWAAGTVTVSVAKTGGQNFWCVAITGSGNDPEIASEVAIFGENAALAETAIEDNGDGSNSVRYAAAFYGGSAASLAAGASSTELHEQAGSGTISWGVYRETTAGSGNRSVGPSAVSDDRAVLYLCVREGLGGTYPNVRAMSSDTNPTAAPADPWTVSLPSSIVANEILLAIVNTNDASWTIPTGWTQLDHQGEGYLIWKLATGSEGATESWDGTSAATVIIYAIEDCDEDTPYTAYVADGAAPTDGPNLAPGIGAKSWLWIQMGSMDRGDQANPGAFPGFRGVNTFESDYSGDAGGTGAPRVFACYGTSPNASMNPIAGANTTFLGSVDHWTIGIPPPISAGNPFISVIVVM